MTEAAGETNPAYVDSLLLVVVLTVTQCNSVCVYGRVVWVCVWNKLVKQASKCQLVTFSCLSSTVCLNCCLAQLCELGWPLTGTPAPLSKAPSQLPKWCSCVRCLNTPLLPTTMSPCHSNMPHNIETCINNYSSSSQLSKQWHISLQCT